MNTVLIFPPQWSVTQPYLSLPSLTAYLKHQGLNVYQYDLNIEVYDLLLSSMFIKQINEKNLARWNFLNSNEFLYEKDYKEYTLLFQANILCPYIIDRIDLARETLRNPQKFYDISLYKESMSIVEKALRVISAAYYPSNLSLFDFSMNRPLLTDIDLLSAIQDEKENMFLYIYKKYFLNYILEKNADIVGISITGISQIIPGLTLAYLIKKERPNIHIVIGGNIFTRLADRIKDFSKLFSIVFDSIILYEGELPLRDLCSCLSNNNDLSIVPNLIYKKNNEIITNPLCKSIEFDLLPTPCFDNINFNLYFSPYPIIPLLSSRGCYWGKCAFCDHGEIYHNRYSERSINLLQKDISFLSNKYSTHLFTFNDEAISPYRLENISKMIIYNHLSIKCLADIRLELQFSEEIFRLAFKAGFLSLYYGLESGHNRVLAHMCKGTTDRIAKSVFRRSSGAGIWNHAFLFFGFPTETKDEADKTTEFVLSNKEIIHSVGCSTFSLNCCSKIRKNPEKYGIDHVYRDEKAPLDLWSSYSARGTSQSESTRMVKEFYELINKNYACFDLWGTMQREHLLSYLAHYGGRHKLPKPAIPNESERMIGATYDLIDDNSIPEFGKDILCGLSKFDIAKLLNATAMNIKKIESGSFIILWDLENSKFASINSFAAIIISNCDGNHNIKEIAAIIASNFNMNYDLIKNYCKNFLKSMKDEGFLKTKLQAATSP